MGLPDLQHHPLHFRKANGPQFKRPLFSIPSSPHSLGPPLVRSLSSLPSWDFLTFNIILYTFARPTGLSFRDISLASTPTSLPSPGQLTSNLNSSTQGNFKQKIPHPLHLRQIHRPLGPRSPPSIASNPVVIASARTSYIYFVS